MAYNTNLSIVTYVSGTNQTVFTFNFKIFDSTNLIVTETDTLGVETIIPSYDYSVYINGDLGGSITFNTGRLSGNLIEIKRHLLVDRNIEYQKNGDLAAQELNDDQEYQTYMIADNDRDTVLNRADIDTNTSNIALNRADIDTNTSNIALNRADIDTNRTDIDAITETYFHNNPSVTQVSSIMPAPKTNSFIGWNENATALVNFPIFDGTVTISESQFADNGTTIGKSVPYVAKTTNTNETIIVKSKQNAFAIDEIIIDDGTELVIEDDAVFKVL